METKRVFNLIILDASGSMQSIYHQALSGVNETIQTIRMAQQDHDNLQQYVTLTSFSSGTNYLHTIYDAKPIAEVNEITREDYIASGCTALYDAMGQQITRMQEIKKHDDLVLVTIITDGYENASQHWTGPQIKSLVEELRQMGWTFTYIGANQDVEKVAATMGVRNSMAFCADMVGTQAMFAKERKSRKSFMAKLSDKVLKKVHYDMEEDNYFADND